MNVAILFQALSQAILISLGQALVIYILTRVVLSAFKGLSPSWRYNLLYSSMVMIFAGFIIAFSSFYMSSTQVVDESLTFKPFAYSGSLPSSWKVLITNHAYWISTIYLVGLSFQATVFLIGYYRLKFSQLRNLLVPADYWTARLEYLQSSLGISRKVSLHFSGEILVPFTAGFMKPLILFPLAMINHLSIEQIESILLHELAHIKRNDYLMNLLQRVMQIILFFNPITWLLAKEIRTEREFSCDDIVLQYSHHPATYARALTLIEEHRITVNTLAMAVSGNKKHDLLTRIKKITNMKTQNSNPKPRLIALFSVLAIGLSIAWIIPSDTEMKTSDDLIHHLIKSDTLLTPPAPPAPPAPANLPVVNQPVKAPAPPKPLNPKLVVPPAPPAPVDTTELKKFFNSKEWKKQMEDMKAETEKMKKQFDSPEWKKQMQDLKNETEKMKKQFDSPEWKKQMQDMKIETEKMKKQFDSPEWKKQIQNMQIEAEKMKKQFNSPEWKKQIQNMQIEAEKMKKQFDSPEWKKQMQDMKIETEKMKKQFDSPEWKKKMSELELQEKN